MAIDDGRQMNVSCPSGETILLDVDDQLGIVLEVLEEVPKGTADVEHCQRVTGRDFCLL